MQGKRQEQRRASVAMSELRVHRAPEKDFTPVAVRRRFSLDVNQPREFLVDVETTWLQVLQQEDTDGDCKITVMDQGPKVISLGTVRSGGSRKYDIRGTYGLSILLQELALAREMHLKYIILDEATLNENPVDRLSRLIRDLFWDGLVRHIDKDGIDQVVFDPKNHNADKTPRVYVPYNDSEAFEYFTEIASERRTPLQVIRLPEEITPHYVKSLNQFPGILSLKLRRHADGHLRGVPYVVPGGRFNEMYGWDSYFETLGLLADGRLALAKDMVENFVYQIEHYGKIMNANRSYYLTRSQPPFLTDMALKVYAAMPKCNESREWLKQAMKAAIKEYRNVWMKEPRYVPEIGLSRYFDEGIGMPPETESTHFNAVLLPYAKKHGMDLEEFKIAYVAGEVQEPLLDIYFIHDRSVRESGHDTTYRLEGKCADLALVDLNCLIYKYELDIAEYIKDMCGDYLETDSGPETSETWFHAAERRSLLMHRYNWDPMRGMFMDYDFVDERKTNYESATTVYPLWCGLATREQAEQIVHALETKFECPGGLVCGTEESRGEIHLQRPNRQWDYPYGWAPHQILAWEGLKRYGYNELAERLAYRWLYMIIKSFVEYNGTVPEKFDVVARSHRVFVEYGNVGTDFSYVTREGFGWMNASFQVGLGCLSKHHRKALGAMIPPEHIYPKCKTVGNVTTLSAAEAAAAATAAHAASQHQQEEQEYPLSYERHEPQQLVDMTA